MTPWPNAKKAAEETEIIVTHSRHPFLRSLECSWSRVAFCSCAMPWSARTTSLLSSYCGRSWSLRAAACLAFRRAAFCRRHDGPGHSDIFHASCLRRGRVRRLKQKIASRLGRQPPYGGAGDRPAGWRSPGRCSAAPAWWTRRSARGRQAPRSACDFGSYNSHHLMGFVTPKVTISATWRRLYRPIPLPTDVAAPGA
jgi:hypothetical protein